MLVPSRGTRIKSLGTGWHDAQHEVEKQVLKQRSGPRRSMLVESSFDIMPLYPQTEATGNLWMHTHMNFTHGWWRFTSHSIPPWEFRQCEVEFHKCLHTTVGMVTLESDSKTHLNQLDMFNDLPPKPQGIGQSYKSLQTHEWDKIWYCEIQWQRA